MITTETAQPPALLPSEEDDAVSMRARFFGILADKEVSQATKQKKIAEDLTATLHRRGRFFFHADFKDFASAMYFDSRRKLLLWMASDEFKSWVSSFAGLNRSTPMFSFAFSALQNEALAGKTSGILPSQYWANKNGAIYISSGLGRMVKIVPTGIEPCDNGTDDVLFSQGNVLSPWEITTPEDPFLKCAIWREAAYENPHGLDILRTWAMSMPSCQRCKPPLVLSGGIGSGKSRTVQCLYDLFGLTPRVGAVTENGEDNFWTSQNSGGLMCLDNVDTKTRWLPDALAAAATDGCHEKRRLYTDGQTVLMRARSWTAVTTSNATFAADAGLADRIIVIRMTTRAAGTTAESSLTDEVLQNRNAGMTFIAIALQKALADTAAPPPINRRHPDFSAFGVRIGRAIGREKEVIEALQSAEADKSAFNLENDTIGSALLEYFSNDETGLTTTLRGTSKEILDAIANTDGFIKDKWSPKKMSKSLGRIWPHLEARLKATKETGHGGFTKFCFHKPEIA